MACALTPNYAVAGLLLLTSSVECGSAPRSAGQGSALETRQFQVQVCIQADSEVKATEAELSALAESRANNLGSASLISNCFNLNVSPEVQCL